jgi:hypothetical protein
MSQTVEFRESVYGQVTQQATGGNPQIISYLVQYAGEHTTIGGAAAEAKTLAGVLATDVVVANLSFQGSTPRTLLKTVPTTDTLTFTFSGNPNTGTAHKVMYAVLRAV